MWRTAASYPLLATITVIAFELANARIYAPRTAQLGYATATAVFLGIVALGWLRAPRTHDERHAPRAFASAPRGLGLLILAAGAYAIHARGVLGPGPLLWTGLLAVAGLGSVACGLAWRARSTMQPSAGTAFVLGGAITTGLALRIFELRVVSIDPRRGDMVPLVFVALRELGQGLPPYRTYRFPWEVPLTYSPLNWLAHGPAYLADVDIRWTSTAAELSILAAIFFVARGRADKKHRDVASMLWAAWFVGHVLIKADGQLVAAVQWAALAWVVALVVEASRSTPVAVGAAIMTTPLVLPLLPTLAIAWHRGRHTAGAKAIGRRRPLWQVAALATVVALLLMLPWFVWSPTGFIDGTVLWFNDLDRYPRAKWNENHAWATYPGFCALFWTWGLERLLKPMQITLIGWCAFRFYRTVTHKPLRHTVGPELVGVAMVFLLFNPMMWGYLWGAPVAIALVATASLPPRA